MILPVIWMAHAYNQALFSIMHLIGRWTSSMQQCHIRCITAISCILQCHDWAWLRFRHSAASWSCCKSSGSSDIQSNLISTIPPDHISQWTLAVFAVAVSSRLVSITFALSAPCLASLQHDCTWLFCRIQQSRFPAPFQSFQLLCHVAWDFKLNNAHFTFSLLSWAGHSSGDTNLQDSRGLACAFCRQKSRMEL